MWLWACMWMLYADGGVEQAFITHDDFYEPVCVRVDKQGALYIPDAKEHKVWIFEADGTFRGSFGREGQGPGEFRDPSDLAFLPDGRILVGDGGNRRVHIFDAQGKFLKMFPIPDQPVGRMLVKDNEHFILSRTNGLGFSFSIGEEMKHRFGVFNLEGKQVSGFGSFVQHENPFLAMLLNDGPMDMMGDTTVYAGLITNDLIRYSGGKEDKGHYALRFEPKEPTAVQKEVKGPGGKVSYQMSVKADFLCYGLAVLNEKEILILRAVHNEDLGEDEDGIPVELVKIGLDGKPIKVYEGRYQGRNIAISPDGRYAYIINELEEDIAIARIAL